jgi:hypothetical protein
MKREPGRWEPIESWPSRFAFEEMEDLVAELPDGDQKRTLERALRWKKPFNHFKQALTTLPDVRQQRFDSH